jgi:hypothetical protein
MLKNIVFFLILPVCLLGAAAIAVFSQPPNGQTRQPAENKTNRIKTPVKPPPKVKGNPTKNPPTPKNNPNGGGKISKSPAECLESEILLRCDLPECQVLLDGKSQGITDLNGVLQFPAANGNRNIVVSRDGYETARTSASVSCGEVKAVTVKLKAKPFEIRLKTNLPNCDIFINDPPELIGKTDDYGVFSFTARSGTVFIQARKTGYLSDSKSVSAVAGQKEVALNLNPMPARVSIITTAKGVFAQAEGDEKIHDASEPFSIEPGRRRLFITALGHKSLTIELTLQPNQRVEKSVELERLPVAGLILQAEQFLKDKSFDKTLRLARYALEAEPNNGAANRLIGTIFLEKQNYPEAEAYLLKALDGGETVVLNVRRHLNEKFELSAGHGAACEGQLLISKSGIEYRGLTATAENFKVSSGNFQILGLQLKKNTALALSLKVTEARGGKKDYNFFSREKELSQDGKPFLSLIQRLLQRR